MLSIICICVGIVLFTAYNAIAVHLFGFPWSMSETYYLYENKKKGLGKVFTIFMITLAIVMLPSWLTISDAVGGWMSNFTFLAFFTCICMMFVGAAPRYKEADAKIHTIAALICAASALTWDFIVCWQIWAVTLFGMFVPAIVASSTKTWKTSRDFWLEMLAFGGTFATMLTQSIIIYLR